MNELFLFLFIGLLIKLFNLQKRNDDKSNKFIIVSALIMFPLTSAIDSGYLLNVWIWIFMSSLFIIADNSYNLN